MHTLPLLVPSPMSSVYGRTDEGTGPWSEHTLANTGPRQYLVIEFDFAEFSDDGKETPLASWIRAWAQSGITIQDACAALLMHLAKRAPLLLIVFSGGKSLHGWFPCLGAGELTLHAWMVDAVNGPARPLGLGASLSGCRTAPARTASANQSNTSTPIYCHDQAECSPGQRRQRNEPGRDGGGHEAHEADTDEATAETAGVNGQEPQATVSDIEQDDEEEETRPQFPLEALPPLFRETYWP